MGKAKLILVSKQIILREALAAFLNTLPAFQIVGATSCCQTGLELAEQQVVDLFLVDVELPSAELEAMASHLILNLPAVSLLLFSNLSSKQRLLELIPLNAQGYLTTDLSSEVFARLLQEALDGKTAISPSIVEEVLDKVRSLLAQGKPASAPKGLTPREKEVLHQLVSGATNREIARSLVISECTVKNHIHNMLDKLKIPNRTKLISHALRSNICSH